MPALSAPRLREVLTYDPETGVFRWRVFMGSRAPAGAATGYADNLGYVQIRVDRRLYKAHRLAWLYVYGEWPDGEVDHINGVTGDNRISNLRVATRSQNIANTKVWCTSKSGVKGVYWCTQQQKWRARLTVNRQRIHIGFFENIADAKAAYETAAQRAFGDFARRA